MIQINELSHSYGSVKALDSISLNVGKGALFGCIGPDGAGKSTLFRIVASLIKPDAGEVFVQGFDTVKEYREIRKIIGYMPGRFALYPDLTVWENLEFFATVFGVNIDDNLSLIEPIFRQLAPFIRRKAADLSGGMKQKLALSCALIHRPKLLILDEPTTGVDAVSRKEFWQMLSFIKSEGITTLVSTSYMDEARQCDTIALMNNGRIMLEESPKILVETSDIILYQIASQKRLEMLNWLRERDFVSWAYSFGDVIHTRLDYEIGQGEFKRLLNEIDAIARVERHLPTVEDIFIEKIST